jgi:hypothetical protein
MKMKSKLEKGGALLAIALSGEVAAQTKDASQDPYIASNEGFEYLFRNWQANRTIAPIRAGRC